MPTPRRALVTGAGGFIGRQTLAPLRAAGYEVHAVISPSSGAAGPDQALGSATHVHRADLLDPAGTEALLEAVRPSHLLHFAWIATPAVYVESSENQRWLDASQHLLRAFQRGGGIRAVFAGSCAEYDWSRVGICHERTSPLAGEAGGVQSAYARSKIAMQRFLAEFGRTHGLSTAWGRIFFQFGPYEHPQRLVASVINDLLAGRAALCTHGRQIRSFLHVADVGGAFAAVLQSPLEGAVNIGSGRRISIGQLLEQVAERIGRPQLLKLGARAAPAGEPAILLPDIARLSGEAGFAPAFDLEHGLDDAIAWWRRARAS